MDTWMQKHKIVRPQDTDSNDFGIGISHTKYCLLRESVSACTPHEWMCNVLLYGLKYQKIYQRNKERLFLFESERGLSFEYYGLIVEERVYGVTLPVIPRI